MLRTLTILLALVVSACPVHGQGGNTADRAKAEALKAFKGSEEFQEAKDRWQAYRRQIGLEVPKQDQAVSAGGSRLDQKISQYEMKAEIEGSSVSNYLAGRILGLAGRLDQARPFFERSVSIDRFFYWGHHGLGTYFAMREMPEPAAKHYQQALDLNPDFAKASRGLAMCHMQLRNYDRAEALFKKVISGEPSDIKTRYVLARMYIQAGRHAEAINELLQIKQRDPSAEKADALLAFCYSRTETLEKAIETYEAVLQRDREDWRSAMELGKIFLRMGRHHDAAVRFQQGLDNLPMGADFDRDRLEELVAELHSGPAVVQKRAGVKTPEEWLEILLNSVEPERRRQAVRVLSQSPVRHAELDKGFLRALKDKDHFVRTVVVRTIRRWWGEAEQLDDRTLVKIMGMLLDDPSHMVRGSVAATLGRTDHDRAVPPLVKRLRKERNPYVFRQIHRALNRLSFAYIGIPLEGDLDVERMEALTLEWRSWYDAHMIQFRAFEDR